MEKPTIPCCPSNNKDSEMDYLHQIISRNRQAEKISEEECFLLIFGYEKEFQWEGYVYKLNIWKKIK